MTIGISKDTLEKLLNERKAMCTCGCGWGESDGHEWEILLLEELINEHCTDLIDDKSCAAADDLPEFLKQQAD